MKCSGPLPFLANWLNCHVTFRGLRFFVTDRLFTGPRLVIRKTLCTPLPLFVSMQLTKRTASHYSHPHRLTLAVSTSLSPRKQLVNTLTTPFSSASTFCLFPVQWQLLNSRVNGGPSIHRRWRLTGWSGYKRLRATFGREDPKLRTNRSPPIGIWDVCGGCLPAGSWKTCFCIREGGGGRWRRRRSEGGKWLGWRRMRRKVKDKVYNV